LFCFLLAFAALQPHTGNGPRNAGSALFLPSLLTLARGSRTALNIDIPEHRPGREVLDPDFACHFGSGLAAPHDAELSSRTLVENVDSFSWL
jgi:hypothetical protein